MITDTFVINKGTDKETCVFRPLSVQAQEGLRSKFRSIPSMALLDEFVAGDFDIDILNELTRRVSMGEAWYSRLAKEDQGGISSIAHIAGIILSERLINGRELRPHIQIEAEVETWARVMGCWITETELRDLSDEHSLFSSGTESRVYVDRCRNNVWKIMHPREGYDSVSLGDMLNEVAIFNSVFKSTHYDVIGFGRDDSNMFCAICQQPVVKGRTITRIGMDEHGGDESWIKSSYEKAMVQRGFEYDCYTWTKDQYAVTDITGSNVVELFDGTVVVIDADVKYRDDMFYGSTFIADND